MKTTINPENLKQLFDLDLTTEDFTLELYLIWAKTVTITMREYQQVIASAPICRWFINEIAKHQKEYEYLISHYKTASVEDRVEFFIKCVYPIFSIFPQALLQEAKKREQKPQTTKVAGITIEFSIINLN
jgi:hypothetical protein